MVAVQRMWRWRARRFFLYDVREDVFVQFLLFLLFPCTCVHDINSDLGPDNQPCSWVRVQVYSRHQGESLQSWAEVYVKEAFKSLLLLAWTCPGLYCLTHTHTHTHTHTLTHTHTHTPLLCFMSVGNFLPWHPHVITRKWSCVTDWKGVEFQLRDESSTSRGVISALAPTLAQKYWHV